MSDWKPGFRHQVQSAPSEVEGMVHWRCVDCGQWFEWWPSDDEECPGPPDPLRQEVGG
jgi:hypothetical protein